MDQNVVINKSQVAAAVRSALLNRIAEANEAIVSAKDARDGDTKSSAGDKYETGREMMQMEMNKAAMQMQTAKKLIHELDKVDLSNNANKVDSGSFVVTSKEIFFVAIGFGKITYEGFQIFVISPASPLGTILINKSAGEVISFQGIERQILSVF